MSETKQTKEIEIVQWVAVDPNGAIVGVFSDAEEPVRRYVMDMAPSPYSAVRLTGTAKIPVTP